jgi:hypothetical protein
MPAAMGQLNVPARAYRRILRLARTIADLAQSEEIQSVYLAEALQDPMDRHISVIGSLLPRSNLTIYPPDQAVM